MALMKRMKVLTDEPLPSTLTLCFDGGCRPTNPGGCATYGWSITHDDLELAYGYGITEERSTNNVSEWFALKHALTWVKKQKWSGKHLGIYGDSMLVINQISGRWKCRKANLQALKVDCLKIIRSFNCTWTATWIPNRTNQRCDGLAGKAWKRWLTARAASQGHGHQRTSR